MDGKSKERGTKQGLTWMGGTKQGLTWMGRTKEVQQYRPKIYATNTVQVMTIFTISR